MTMTPTLRKFALTAHVTFSVGWLGAVVAYLALAITGLTSRDVQKVRAAYLAMEMIGWFVIVPFSLAGLLTGLVQSLGTAWGLFRHYWVLVKFLLTTGGTIVLLRHMQAVSRMSRLAAETSFSGADSGALRVQLVVHAGGGLLVLLAATVLSVYKPWGRTRYGRRILHARGPLPPVPPIRRTTAGEAGDTHLSAPPLESSFYDAPGVGLGRRPFREYVPWVVGVVLVLLFIILHLAGGGLRGH